MSLGGGMSQCVCRGRGQVAGVSSHFHPLGAEDRIQVIRLGSKQFYLGAQHLMYGEAET